MTPVMQTNSCGNVLLFFVSCVLSHNFIFPASSAAVPSWVYQIRSRPRRAWALLSPS